MKRVDVFSTESKLWSTATELNYSIHGFDAVTVNNIIYCAGGYSGNSLNEKMQYFDVSTGTWTTGKSIPKVGTYTAVAKGNTIYYTMSKFNSGNITVIYNTANNKWSLGQSRAFYSIDNSQVDNGKILNLTNDFLMYINTDSQSSVNQDVKYVYLPDKNVWAVIPNMFSFELEKDKILAYNNRIFSLEEQTQSNGSKKSIFKIIYLYNDKVLYEDNSAFAVGDRHILFVENGTLKAKGNNDYGQLGNGTNNESVEFINVNSPWSENGEKIRMVAAGANTSYVITDKNNLYAWGLNTSGNLGNGSSENITTPELVESNVVSVSAGKLHTVIMKQDGSIWTSGNNQYGQLARTSANTNKFVRILGINEALKIECGDYQTFFIDKNNTLYSCGKNDLGQIGTGSDAEYISEFSQVATNIKDISSGYNHTLALTNQGSVYSWGSNSYKQLGASEIESRNTPELISGIAGVDEIKAGGNTSIYLKDGNVYKWGRSMNSTHIPQKVNGISNVASIYAGDIIVALDTENNMWQWGLSTYAQEFFDTNKTRNPVKIHGLHSSYGNINITDITARRHQVMVASGNTVFAWGSGYFGTGDDSEETFGYFKEIQGLYARNEKNSIIRGKNFNLCIDDRGSLYGWGSNTNSPMGNQGGKVKVATIVPEFAVTEIEDDEWEIWKWNETKLVAAGDGFMVAYVLEKNDVYRIHRLYTMGANDVGQLGYGTTGSPSNERNEIIKIENGYMTESTGDITNQLAGITALAAGDDFVVAVMGNNLCVWGGNEYGQLGLGHTNDVNAPKIIYANQVFVAGTDEHFVDVKTGPDFCIGLTSAGNVYSWGKNTAGQLGLGHKNTVYVPTKVEGLSNVQSIGAGNNHAMAIKEDGTLWTWGYSSEQLGRDKKNASIPVQVSGIPQMAGVSGGYGFTVAYDVNGNLWTFGSNDKGALCIYTEIPCNVK